MASPHTQFMEYLFHLKIRKMDKKAEHGPLSSLGAFLFLAFIMVMIFSLLAGRATSLEIITINSCLLFTALLLTNYNKSALVKGMISGERFVAIIGTIAISSTLLSTLALYLQAIYFGAEMRGFGSYFEQQYAGRILFNIFHYIGFYMIGAAAGCALYRKRHGSKTPQNS